MPLPIVNTGDFEKNVKLMANFNNGKIQVKKVSEETSEPIEGVTFELLDSNGKQISTAITNKEGIANFENLYPGNYQIREVSTDEHFILNPEAFDITVEWNKTTTKTITNTYKKGSLKIIKTDAETEQPIAGVSFDLLDIDGNVVQTGTTNEQGEVFFENLVIGKYQLKETSTNQNYVINMQTTEVEINYNEMKIQNIKNERKKGSIQVCKVDKDNHKIVLEDVEFELYSKELDKLIGVYTTDENGEIFIDNLRIGEYELREITTKKGYEIGEDVNISVEWEKTTKVTIENRKIPELPKKEVKKLPKTGF